MNKGDLITKMATDASISKSQATMALNSFMTATSGALRKGEKVTLVGFGTFGISKRSARKGRNPQTGKVILEVPGIDSGKRLPAIESRFKDMPGILHQFYCSESNTVYFEVNSESLAIIQEQFHSMAIICNVKQQSSLQKIQNACNNGTE